MSDHQHPEFRPDDIDLVFNDETCRALRYNGRRAGRVMAVVGTFMIGLVIIIVVSWQFSLFPLADFALRIALSVAVAVATVGVMRWVDLVPNQDTLREAWIEMKHDLFREARAHVGDPQAIETRVLEDANNPPARPELAVGLAPEECFIVFGIPLLAVVGAVGTFEGLTAILSVGACLALSGALFVFVNHSSAKVNTYPPENPPCDRQREPDDESVRGYQ